MSSCARARGSSLRWGRILAWGLTLVLVPSCDRSEVEGPAVEADPPTAKGSRPETEAVARPEPEAEAEDADGADSEGLGDDDVADAEVVAEPAPPPGPDQAGECPDTGADHLGILVSPAQPREGEPLRVLAASLEDESLLAMRLEDGEGQAVEAELVHYGGVPAATVARLPAPAAGTRLRVVVGRGGEGLRCRSVRIRRASTKGRAVAKALADGVWPVKRRWDAAEEALFSAWLRELFHAPRGDELAWSALHEVTTDADRNLLHDHLGWSEDSMPTKGGMFLRPDCADTPYFLRAYFAWKRRLPFGFRRCNRGRAGTAPACGDVHGVVGAPDVEPVSRLPGELGVVQRFFKRTLAWGVHTGNGRTAFGEDATDFYPVELSRRGLRPGVIYADPYGHIFVVAELMAPQGDTPGVLYAIDGQPDGSITRKRFWEGNFLWNPDPALGGSGFKAFRPHRVGPDGEVVALSDAEIEGAPGYGDLGLEQAELDAPAFYDRMDGLITPGIRDPLRAQEEAIQALHESAKVRVTSVDNGEDFHAKSGSVIDMPDGFAIFETTGAWENYSTPARDLRLLIAIDVATGFEGKVVRQPAAWGVEAAGGEATVRERLSAARERLLADPALAFSYTRSDGSTWTLTLAELVARAPALEAAYNPNDCPEVRWAAPKGSDERSTCRRRAPAEQQRKMRAYEPWFHERRRPPRGDPGPPVEE